MPKVRGAISRRSPQGLAQEPTWIGTPAPQFTDNADGTYSVIPFTSGFNTALDQFVHSGVTLPTNVTVNPADGYVKSGASSVQVASGAYLTITDTPLGDFTKRMKGATYSTNWSEYADAAAAYNGAACYGANKNPGQGSTFTNAFELVTDHGKSGKAMRLWHGKNGQGAGTIDNQYWAMLFNGGKTAGEATSSFRTKAYVQVVVWVDAMFDYYWKKSVAAGGGGVTPKAFIVDYDAGTATQGEVVVDNQFSRGFVTTYRHTGSSSAVLVAQARSTPANGSNFAWQPAIDRGTPAVITTQNQWEQRYGPCYDGMTGGTSQASLLSTQGVPDPDAAIGGVPWNRGGYTVVELELDLAADRIRTWAAKYGEAPVLVADTMKDDLGTAVFGSRVKPLGVGWNALFLSNLAFEADWENNPGAPLAFIDYPEIGFSRNPIRFPGGFYLPGV